MVPIAGAGPGQNLEPKASSGSPKGVQRHINREVDRKWSSRNLNQSPYGMSVLQVIA